jgi:hypothetical protein
MLRKQQGLSCTGMYITQQEEEEEFKNQTVNGGKKAN